MTGEVCLTVEVSSPPTPPPEIAKYEPERIDIPHKTALSTAHRLSLASLLLRYPSEMIGNAHTIEMPCPPVSASDTACYRQDAKRDSIGRLFIPDGLARMQNVGVEAAEAGAGTLGASTLAASSAARCLFTLLCKCLCLALCLYLQMTYRSMHRGAVQEGRSKV